MIKLKCVNSECAYCYEVSQKELENNQHYHKYCIVCGSQLKIDNLEEVIRNDIYKKAEENINKWFNKIGWDRTIDLIKRNKEQSYYRIYKEILEQKGFRINE